MKSDRAIKNLAASVIAGLVTGIGLHAQAPSFNVEVVDNQIDIGYGIAIGDVDGDRRPDILMADKTEIVWYKNPGARGKKWERYVIARDLTVHDNVCIAARDIDGDGKVEVAAGAQWNPSETNDPAKSGAVFYLKRPDDPTQLWSPVRLHHEVTIHRMAWGRTPEGAFQLLVLPLHGLGNSNGEGEGVKWIAYDVPKDIDKPWKYQLLDTKMHLTHNFQVLEEKGKPLRAAVGGKEGVQVLEYSGDKWKLTGNWLVKDHPVGEIQVGRLQGGNGFTATVEPMHGTHVMLTDHKQDRVTLSDAFMQGHALGVGDLLGQGYDQVVAGWRNPNKNKQVGIRLFTRNDHKWNESIVDDSVRMACEDLKLADLDGDGKPDIIASGRATLNVLIYWNNN